ncbi:MAG: type VI secretion system tube protein Hcp [Pirellulaceae bacterium]|nr:type VI secretion system tube protein Hcp [Pirellulaceae bacterium]
MIVVQIQGVPGDVKIPGYDKDKWFVAESIGFGVGKSVEATKSSKDIEIGKKDEQELTIEKTVDCATVYLMYLAMKGRSGTESGFFAVDIHMIETTTNGGPVAAFLKIRIENAMIKQWDISADQDERPTESLRIWFNKSAMKYRSTHDGVTFSTHGPLGWDEQANKDWKPQRLLIKDD